MPDPNDYDEFAIVPVYADSAGRKATPQNAIFSGSRNAVMERIIDSRTRRESLTLLNEAKHIREEKRALVAERADVAKRTDAVTQAEDLIRQLCDQIGTLTARVDAFEEAQRAKDQEEERARDPDNQITLPPGSDSSALGLTRDQLDEPEHPLLDPELVADEDDPQAMQTHGELTIHPPTAPEDREQLAAALEDDEGEGDLPPELTAKAPPIPGTAPEFPKPREPTVRNPVGTNW
jgi:hypothetical protein